ncbi:MAG: hypothetical protein KGL54_13475 [Sphingomonadales bacterium]|nr:hypothetical protein [Sphingomonadales bacterium]
MTTATASLVRARALAAPRQRRNPPRLAPDHNLGGMPSQNVLAVAILGLADA